MEHGGKNDGIRFIQHNKGVQRMAEMTFREQLIASRPQEPISPELAEALNGSKCPDFQKDPIAASQWWIDAEAKQQVRRADAIIAAMATPIPKKGTPKVSPAKRLQSVPSKKK